nr:MAG TPA: hypothetical protein [Caudoviricetes sp.]
MIGYSELISEYIKLNISARKVSGVICLPFFLLF